jgi:HEAT repeat protein
MGYQSIWRIKMPIPGKRNFRGDMCQLVQLVVYCSLLTGFANGQVEQTQSDKPALHIEKYSTSEAIEKVKEDSPLSMQFVEQIVRAKASQAIPMLEDKFGRTEDGGEKSHIASALVRLGDKNYYYWDFLMQQANLALESDAPEFMNFDSKGKLAPGPSPAFIAWAKAHKQSPEALGEQEVYVRPEPIGFLADTGDPRAIPLLRRALLSPNFMIQSLAAEGLGEMKDIDSVPLIIEACKLAPADVAISLAKTLAYFDDPRARAAFDMYLPTRSWKELHDARAKGYKPY